MPRLTLPAVLLIALPAVGADPLPYREPELLDAERQHWSFVPPKRSPVPAVRGKDWVRTPVDAFVLARLEAKGLTPSPTADKRALIRRLTVDLTGLPPTPAEVEAFLADDSPTAYEKVVDRLLASPHYGERWAQHWLDVVRFAESNGYELDGERPQAWRYRDWVIRALNADVPYDRFVREQLAGDLLAAGKDPREAADLWLATGLHRCGPVHVVSGNLDKEVVRQEVLTEMVNGVGSAVLGLTVACARCHDHKFDPISLGDYYRLQAFFAGTRYKDVDLATDEQKQDLQRKLLSVSIKLSPVKKQIADLEAPYRAKLAAEKRARLDPWTRRAVDTATGERTPAQAKLAEGAKPLLKITWDEVLDRLTPEDREKRAALKAEQHRLELELPDLPPQAWAVADDDKAPTTHVLRRGDVNRKSVAVGPGYLRVVGGEGAPKNRLDLARWLTQPDHPLTARVMANRLWQHHFGRGIVGTSNDFGTRGEKPTHPELLDWLARELVEPTWGTGEPWSLKRMHRLMVCSATYRQVSNADRGSRNAERTDPSVPRSEFRDPRSVDPDNRLLWRMNRRRLEAEAIRDAILTAAGTLTPDVGGPSVKVPLEPEVYDLIFTEDEPSGLWRVTPDPKQHTRRSVYLFVKRNVRLPMLEAFDQPDTLNPCAARSLSTFAPQALILMNGPFAREQAGATAADLVRTVGEDPARQVDALYRRALGRPPSTAEVRVGVEFLRGQAPPIRDRMLARQPVGIPAGLPDGTDPAAARALADLCLAVFNTNEFVYVP
jgi:hypothetical protein